MKKPERKTFTAQESFGYEDATITKTTKYDVDGHIYEVVEDEVRKGQTAANPNNHSVKRFRRDNEGILRGEDGFGRLESAGTFTRG